MTIYKANITVQKYRYKFLHISRLVVMNMTKKGR